MSEDDEVQVIDLVPDEMALARSQIDSTQYGLAEGTVRRRLARFEADGVGLTDETDALHVLLAEALWRQGRPAAARIALDAVTIDDLLRVARRLLAPSEARLAVLGPFRSRAPFERALRS